MLSRRAQCTGGFTQPCLPKRWISTRAAYKHQPVPRAPSEQPARKDSLVVDLRNWGGAANKGKSSPALSYRPNLKKWESQPTASKWDRPPPIPSRTDDSPTPYRTSSTTSSLERRAPIDRSKPINPPASHSSFSPSSRHSTSRDGENKWQRQQPPSGLQQTGPSHQRDEGGKDSHSITSKLGQTSDKVLERATKEPREVVEEIYVAKEDSAINRFDKGTEEKVVRRLNESAKYNKRGSLFTQGGGIERKSR
ncbi:hypothetical protein M422DRAFT_276612, partial [Sphaerobolus stellatus SS14]